MMKADYDEKNRTDSKTQTTCSLEPGYWQERWKQQRLARLAVPKVDPPNSFWNDKRKVRDHFMQNLDGYRKEAEERIAMMRIPDGSRVLDIGAGTGTYAVPLAAHGCDVVAVEPGEAMREALVAYREQQKTRPITIIPKKWDEIVPVDLGEPFDIVLSSYSLMLTDIGKAIRMMEDACREGGTVQIFWFLTQPLTARLNTAVWPLVHGAEFPGEPTADCLWNALCDMGIYANLIVEQGCEPAFFPSIEDAVRTFSPRLNCSTPEQETVLRKYCETSLQNTHRGYRVPGNPLGAHIWWSVRKDQDRF